jgi:phospholipid/cholesterol/gamma-HCH transport system substrate-binding protein
MERLRVQLRRYGRSFLVLVALWIVGIAAAVYILLQQRLPNPFSSFVSVNGTFQSAAGVVPGLGEPVNVAGVKVGQITGTSLKDGQAIIHMQIDPNKLPGRDLYRNASATLFPNTPLKDMEVNVNPGTPSAGRLAPGGTIPVGQTTIPTDSDELTAALDTDTRTWFTSLITDLNQGVSGRGSDIKRLLQNLGPTSAQLREIGDLLAARRHELAQIVHNLGTLTAAVATKDGQLQTVVRAGSQTVQALASQDQALRTSILRLPGVLATTRQTLGDLVPFSNALGPTATALMPTARRLPTTLRESRTLFQGAALLPLNKIPPFVRVVLPLAQQLQPALANLEQAVPPLTSSFKVLGAVTNEIAYVPGHGNPGFLYWLAWFVHNGDSFLSVHDANGGGWRLLNGLSCTQLNGGLGTYLKQVLGSNLGSLLGCK